MDFIEEIKNFLKVRGWNREQLGKEVGVSKRTVDNWLCGSYQIPPPKKDLLMRLMAPAPEPAPAPAPALGVNAKILNVLLTRDEFELCARAAQKERLPVEEWARRVVLARTAGIQAEKRESTS